MYKLCGKRDLRGATEELTEAWYELVGTSFLINICNNCNIKQCNVLLPKSSLWSENPKAT